MIFDRHQASYRHRKRPISRGINLFIDHSVLLRYIDTTGNLKLGVVLTAAVSNDNGIIKDSYKYCLV